MSPNYYVQDGVIPRTRLPEVLERIDELAAEYDLKIANVFHAGTETCTRSSATTARCPARPSAPRSSPGWILQSLR